MTWMRSTGTWLDQRSITSTGSCTLQNHLPGPFSRLLKTFSVQSPKVSFDPCLMYSCHSDGSSLARFRVA